MPIKSFVVRVPILIFCVFFLNFKGLNASCNNAIVFTGNNNLYIADLCQDKYSQLTYDNSSFHPVVLPDRKLIALESSSHITVMDVDGSSHVSVSAQILFPSFPAWSPDGHNISLSGSTNSEDDSQIYVAHPDGSDLHQFVSTSGNTTMSAWSPDGKYIAFVIHHGESQHSIDLVRLEDMNLVEFSLPIGEYLQDFITWSPDSQTLAFVASDQIYLLTVDTLSARQLTNFAAATGSPMWSPDGTQIVFEGRAYSQGGNPNWQIYIMNLNTGEVTQITFDGESRWPIWSTDGNSIAFVSARANDFDWGIYMMSKDGSNQVKIAQPADMRNISPIWVSKDQALCCNH